MGTQYCTYQIPKTVQPQIKKKVLLYYLKAEVAFNVFHKVISIIALLLPDNMVTAFLASVQAYIHTH
jgi:hypothetical protein